MRSNQVANERNCFWKCMRDPTRHCNQMITVSLPIFPSLMLGYRLQTITIAASGHWWSRNGHLMTHHHLLRSTRSLNARYAVGTTLDRIVLAATLLFALVAERVARPACVRETYIPLMAWDMEYQMPYIQLLPEFLTHSNNVQHHCRAQRHPQVRKALPETT